MDDQNQSAPQNNPQSATTNPQPAPPKPVDASAKNVPGWDNKSKKRGKLIAIIIAVIIVLLGAGGALAYQYWYQNPNKVLADAVVNAMKAKSIAYKGTLDITGEQKMKITVDGENNNEAYSGKLNAKATFALGGKEHSLDGSAVFAGNGDLYFRLNGIDTLMAPYSAALPPESKTLLDQIIAKVNNKWIKVSSDDLAVYNKEFADSQKCISELSKKMKEDKTFINEATDVYKKHQFIKVSKELGSKDGSLGYQLTSDEAAGKAFSKAFKNTKLYKQMHECNKDFVIEDNPAEATKKDGKEPTVEVWVSTFAHEFTKGSIKSDDNSTKASLLIEPIFNKPTNIKAPEGSVTLKELQDDINVLFQATFAPEVPVTPTEV